MVDIGCGPDEPSDQTWIKVKNNRNQMLTHGGNRPNQKSLVVSGVALGTRGMQLAHYFVNKVDVEICDWELLTKREDATFLTFKIVVKNGDAGKLEGPSDWPEGWRIRPYKPPSAKKTTSQRKPADPGKRERVTNIASPVPTSSHGNNAATSRMNEMMPGLDWRQLLDLFPRNPAGETFDNISQPGSMNGGNWSRPQNEGLLHPQNVAGGIATMGNMMRENRSYADSVGRNFVQGNGIPQYSPAMSPISSRPFDMTQSNPGYWPPNTLYVPPIGKQKQVRIVDRIGTDTFSNQY